MTDLELFNKFQDFMAQSETKSVSNMKQIVAVTKNETISEFLPNCAVDRRLTEISRKYEVVSIDVKDVIKTVEVKQDDARPVTQSAYINVK